ncbi:transcriptional regulator GutM [Pantoea endophytica]
MDPVNSLICVAALAWGTQITLGWLQINRFNRALMSLSNSGRVRIGRSAGRFKPRVVLGLAVNDDGRIAGNFVMKGFTVFSSPYNEEKLNGCMLSEIHPESLFPSNKLLQEALALAISNKR